MQGYCSACGSIIYDVTDETHIPGPNEVMVCRQCGTVNTTKPKVVEAVEEVEKVPEVTITKPKPKRR